MWAVRNSQLGNMHRISVHGGSATNGTSCPLPTRFREHCGIKGTKIVRAKGQGQLDGAVSSGHAMISVPRNCNCCLQNSCIRSSQPPLQHEVGGGGHQQPQLRS